MQHSRYFWHATHQQIYRELATLETHGYIERVSSPSPSTEKQYTLTPQGRDALAQWIAQPSEPGVLREDLLLKVRAGSLVPPEVLVAEIRRRRALHAERLEVYRALQEHDFPEPQQLSYEQRLLYLPLLHPFDKCHKKMLMFLTTHFPRSAVCLNQKR